LYAEPTVGNSRKYFVRSQLSTVGYVRKIDGIPHPLKPIKNVTYGKHLLQTRNLSAANFCVVLWFSSAVEINMYVYVWDIYNCVYTGIAAQRSRAMNFASAHTHTYKLCNDDDDDDDAAQQKHENKSF
uniref:Uncharacterized protein n=1 Tax=Glossina palpalis gambiensis TaxID=67801 RepID=A0A1B0C2Q5_9MUSC